MGKLPEKPSELIRLALRDLRGCEANPLYEIEMMFWHDPYDGACLVCFAGSVIAGTLGRSPDEKIGPLGFDRETCKRLFALNLFRVGSVAYGLEQMGIGIDWPKEDVPDYVAADPQPFHAHMAGLADRLERAGL